MSYYQEHEILPIIDIKIDLDFPAHLHKEIEIGYIEKGSSILVIDDVEYSLCEGDFFAVFPNCVHHYYNSKNLCCHFGIFSPLDVEALLSFRPKSPVVCGKSTPIELLMRILTGENPYRSKEFERAIFAAVCNVFFKMTELESISRYNDDTLKDILIYINNNFKTIECIDDVSRSFGISSNYISHLFTKKMSVTFTDYINSIRARFASKLIEETNKTMTQIAFESGFGSVRSFNRIFLSVFKCTPLTYRKIHKKA